LKWNFENESVLFLKRETERNVIQEEESNPMKRKLQSMEFVEND